MTREDGRWCLIGVILGLWVAYGTMQKGGFVFDAPVVSRAAANVLGSVISALILGRIIRLFRKSS